MTVRQIVGIGSDSQASHRICEDSAFFLSVFMLFTHWRLGLKDGNIAFRLVEFEISQRLLQGLLLHVAQTFMVPRG